MIDRSGEDHPVLGEPPDPPEDVWQRAMEHALDPWSVPQPALVPSADPRTSVADDGAWAPEVARDGDDDDPGAGPSDDVADLTHLHDGHEERGADAPAEPHDGWADDATTASPPHADQ